MTDKEFRELEEKHFRERIKKMDKYHKMELKKINGKKKPKFNFCKFVKKYIL